MDVAGLASGKERSMRIFKGHLTQTWLATSDQPAAKVSGAFWFHRKQQKPAAAALDVGFQDRLIAKLAEMTGVA
jgi:hypothetical protein